MDFQNVLMEEAMKGVTCRVGCVYVTMSVPCWKRYAFCATTR